MKIFKFAVLAAVLFAANPRVGSSYNGQIYAVSCTAQAGFSVGANGIGYAYLDHSNPFSGLAMQGLGC